MWDKVFRRLAKKVSILVGSPRVFVMAVAVLVVWGISGLRFHFSDTWQLVINTATTIVTFLMVFLIQNTQNRDTRAIQLKLDELIRAVADAKKEVIGIEDKTDEEIDKVKKWLLKKTNENQN